MLVYQRVMVTNQLRSLSHSVAELKAPFISIYVLWHLVAATYAPHDASANVGWTRVNKIEHLNFPKPWTFKSDTAPSMHWKPKHWMASLRNWSHGFFQQSWIGHMVFSTKLTTESHPIVSTATPAESQLDIKDIHSCINCCLPFCSHPFPTLTVISFSTASISSSSCSGSFWCIPSDTSWLISPRGWCRDSTVPYGEAPATISNFSRNS